MYKNFILILFALLFFTGCDTGKGHKCDYYTDNLSIDYVRILVNGKYKQDITGTVCDSQDKRSFIQIKNGLAHGNSKLYYKSGALKVEGNFKHGEIDGNVRFTFDNGDIYEGVLKNNAKKNIWTYTAKRNRVMKVTINNINNDILYSY